LVDGLDMLDVAGRGDSEQPGRDVDEATNVLVQEHDRIAIVY